MSRVLLPSRAMPQEQLLDPQFPDVDMHLVLPGEPVTGRIVKNESCMCGKSASYVHHIEIDVSGTPLEGHFRVGQAFGVIPPGVDDLTSSGGPSILSSPSDMKPNRVHRSASSR